MALIATYVGREINDETGEKEFVIRLKAETKEDVPALLSSDVWNKTPLVLARASLPEEPR